MATSKKAVEYSKRLRYVRALERFHKSINSYLANTPEPTKEQFIKKVDNGLKFLNRVEEAVIYKGELRDLENLVKKILKYREDDTPIEKIKEEINYASNQLDKSKNARRYKKDKHSRSKYKDWE
ncbi:MAG: hypothetical protein ABXS93_00845 [Sulfurimonas sp.]